MRINRDSLIERLFNFSQAGSGVVIGQPGVGKSYSLSELSSLCISKGIPSIVLRLDQLVEGSDKEVQDLIGLRDEWLETLNKILPPSDVKGILIFDAFDAARDQNLRNNFLALISKAKTRLAAFWNIIVSVRTYDAAKSPRLINLFPKSLIYGDTLACRNFIIPPLSKIELDTFFIDDVLVGKAFNESHPKLQEVLAIPFFLSIFKQIVQSTLVSQTELKGTKSEIELLEQFWKLKVSNTEDSLHREFFLKQLTEKMVILKNLTINKLDQEIISSQHILTPLLSDNILSETGISFTKVGYSHNILFDFAVSKLIIPDKAQELVEFIIADPSRPYFLRPSFNYFFSRLWYYQPETFWALTKELMRNEDHTIQLFSKLIPSTVIAQEFDSAANLHPGLQVSAVRDQLIQNILQAIRFHKFTRADEGLVEFLFEVADSLALAFLWDYTIVLEQVIQSSLGINSGELFQKCGYAARAVLSFAIKHCSEFPQLVNLGSIRGVEIVSITYSSDIETSRKLLGIVLSFIQTPGFEIRYLSTLCENVKYFFDVDPEFAAEIYRKVYIHREDSQEETVMGASVLLNFRSNRKQDFDMCRYRLEQNFPAFLNINPIVALPLGLEITNKTVAESQMLQEELLQTEPSPFVISLDGIKTKYIPDLSYIWDGGYVQESASRIIKTIFEYFEVQIKNQDQRSIKTLTQNYFAHAKVAFTWKKLLAFCANYPENFSHLMLSLITNSKVLFHHETVYEAGNFIQNSIEYYSKDDIHSIEIAVWKMVDEAPEGSEELANKRANRFLNLIPKNLLQEARSVEFLRQIIPVQNAPLIEFHTTSEVFTEEMYFADKGIDLTPTFIQQILDLKNILAYFNNQFLNESPSREDYLNPMESVFQLFPLVSDWNQDLTNTEVKIAALSKVAETCNIIIRSVNTLESSEFQHLKEIILYCLNIYTESDKYAEEHYSPGSIYTSTPKINAAEGLVPLLRLDNFKEILPLIYKFSEDANSVVRFKIIKNIHLLYDSFKEDFWTIVKNRLKSEKDWFTGGVLISQLNNRKLFLEEENNIINCLQITSKNILSSDFGRNSFLESFLLVLLNFYAITDNKEANDIISNCTASSNISKEMVFVSFKLLDPDYINYTNQNHLNYGRKILNIIGLVLGKTAQNLKTVNFSSTEDAKEDLSIIDTIVQRIYFALRIRERKSDGRTRNRSSVSDEENVIIYSFFKPILSQILSISHDIQGGLVIAHTAHYFIQIMGSVLDIDTSFALMTTNQVTKMSAATGYTFDRQAVTDAVNLTENLLADHKELLNNEEAFNQLVDLLNLYVDSGWPEALELLWKLDEVFR